MLYKLIQGSAIMFNVNRFHKKAYKYTKVNSARVKIDHEIIDLISVESNKRCKFFFIIYKAIKKYSPSELNIFH